MSVGVCGTGLMGAATARRLLDCGVEVAVWNRTPERANPLVERGARRLHTPRELAAQSSLVISWLADADALRATLDGADGLLAGEPRLLVQMATLAPPETAEIGRLLGSVPALDAPATGSVPAAEAGSLRILCGGDAPALDRGRATLGLLGTVVPVGEWGTGTALKLVLNAANSPMVALLGESLALGAALGLQRSTLLDELEYSRIGDLVRRKRNKLASGEYPADSTLRLFAKDMAQAARTAHDLGVRADLIRLVSEQAAEAVAEGFGAADYSAMAQFLSRRRD